MWAKYGTDFKEVQRGADWLNHYKEVVGHEWVSKVVWVVQDIPLILNGGVFVDKYFEGIANSHFDLVGKGKHTKVCDTPEDTRGGELLSTYGVFDLKSTPEDIVTELKKHYPDILRIGVCPSNKYAIDLRVVRGGFRFHKNGGYRGGDVVGECVADSPAKEYMMFSILLVESC